MSAPVASSLTAAPKGALFAWIENAEGRRNLWVASPTEPARQLTHYTEDDGQELTQLAWSPEATQIAYVYGAETGASGQPANPAHLQRPTALQLIIQPLAADAQPIILPRARQPLFLDEHTLLFVRDGAIWSATLTAQGIGETHQLIFDRGSATSLTLSPDRKLLAYVSLRRQPTHPAHAFIALYDFAAKTLRFLAPSTGVDFAPSFSPDGKMLAWLRHPFLDPPEFATNRVSATPWSIQLWDFEKNEGHMVYQPEANKPGSVLPRLSSGNPYLLWTYSSRMGLMVQNFAHPRSKQESHLLLAAQTSKPTRERDSPPDTEEPRIVFFSESDGFLHLYAADPQKSNAQPDSYQMTGSSEVGTAVTSPDQRSLYFSSNAVVDEHHAEADDPLDVERSHIWIENGSPNFGGVGPVRFTTGAFIDTSPVVSGDGEWLAFLRSSATEPTHVMFHKRPLVMAPGGEIITLRSDGKPEYHPMLNFIPARERKGTNGQFVTPKLVLFDATDGVHLHSQLFETTTPKPPSGRRAAIIYVHGGPKRQMYLGYPDGQYYSNAYAMNQYLASRGFLVLSVNYRCGIGYGLEFRQCEDSGASGAKEYNDVLAAVKYLRSRPDVDPKRIGIWGGSYGGYLTALALARNSDLFAAGVDFHGVHDWILEDNRDDWLRGTNAEQDAIAAKAHASSPLADIDKWRSPVLLIQGDDDPDVAYEQTPTLAEALEAHHVPHETLVFPDEVHSFLLHKDWLAAYEAAAKFFERTLQPGR